MARRLFPLVLALAATTLLVLSIAAGWEDPWIILSLPYVTSRSLLRMAVAYLVSLGFALLYGYNAATNRTASRLLVPVLDVLQSVPILGFLPAAIFLFASSLPQVVGYEVASIFLIFTSMAWNMAFGVYESIIEIPKDLVEATEACCVTGWLRFRRLTLPSTIPRLVYNSMLSWTNGWFFLVAAEILISGEGSGGTVLPGLGSFLGGAAGLMGSPPDYALLLVGLGALVLTVLLIDALLWRPLQVWSEVYKMEYGAGGERRSARFPLYIRLRWLSSMPRVRQAARELWRPLSEGYGRVAASFEGFYNRHGIVFRILRYVDLGLAVAVLGVLAYLGVQRVGLPFVRSPPPEVNNLGLALLLSFLRLVAGYAVTLVWTIPVAYVVANSARAYRYLTPILEVAGSVPAPALMPLMVGLVLGLGGNIDTVAVIVTIIAMQWYLLFNLLGAFRAIPGDLREAADSLGLRGWLRWKRLLLPAIFPSLVTGSITAWGAGWNALIVSEYVNYRNQPYYVLGLGYLLDKGTIINGTIDPDLVILSVGTMILAVLALNYFVWKPLYRLASSRFKVEY